MSAANTKCAADIVGAAQKAIIAITPDVPLPTFEAPILADDAPEIHTADTHGATELVFAGFDLLGESTARVRAKRADGVILGCTEVGMLIGAVHGHTHIPPSPMLSS